MLTSTHSTAQDTTGQDRTWVQLQDAATSLEACNELQLCRPYSVCLMQPPVASETVCGTHAICQVLGLVCFHLLCRFVGCQRPGCKVQANQALHPVGCQGCRGVG